ncbi:MAG: ribosome biogenesis GTPase Der [Hyphomicrobiales bacterium]|nr:ribosome biogenesis GTPase Der [Hyphomicrobiales bacterium]
MAPKVAIIGRPNVGKSTLFNRLVGRKLALVDDRPGVTRDRRVGEAHLGRLDFDVIDTAGLEEGSDGALPERMRRQTEVAVADADVILFVVDARAGLTLQDEHFARLVRRSGKPIVLVANKSEGRAGEAGANEAFALGLGTPVAISAEHAEGMGDLEDALAAALPKAPEPASPDEDFAADDPPPAELGEEEDGSDADPARPLRLAVVGQPNAGKSTLLNRIVGEERLLTGPEPGLTRDSISLDARWRGRELKLFDTAGLRRKAKVQDKLEKLAAADGIRAVRFAEVVILLVDATLPFEKQDLTIADLVASEGRALVIGLNKWDAAEDRGKALTDARETIETSLPQVRGVEIVPLSGRRGTGVDALLEAALRAHDVWNRRIATAKLNRWLGPIVDATPPPAVAGRRIKIRFMTQPKARPPFFILFGNQLDKLPESYKRFLVNGLRATFKLPGTPIRLSVRTGENPYDKSKRG